MEIVKMKMQTFWIPFFPRVSFQGAVRRICRFLRFLRAACRLGVALLLDARTIFEGYKGGWGFSGASGAGRSEIESEGSLLDLPNSLVAVGTANALGDVDIAGACGKHDLDGHVVEFELLQPAAFAEFGYVHRLNSGNSLICLPSMNAPSLARVIDGKSGRVCGMDSGEGGWKCVERVGHCTVGCFVA